MLKIISLLVMLNCIYAFIAYDCYTPTTNYTTVALTKIKECKPQNDDRVQVKPYYIQVIQERRWRYLHVEHCHVIINKLIHYCGFHSHISAVSGGYKNYMMEIGRKECHELHTDGVLNIEGTKIRNIKPNTTQDADLVLVGSINSDGTCQGKSYVTPNQAYENVVVQITTTITLKDYDTLLEISTSKILFNDGTTCDIDKADCLHPFFGFTFWESSKLDNCSPSSRDVVYEGESQVSSDDGNLKPGSVVSVNMDTSLFSLSIKSDSHVCHQRAFSTDHDRIYIIRRERFGFFFVKSSIINQNVDLTMYMNSKITYTTLVTEKLIKKLYSEMTLRDCELERKTLINRLAIIRQHPQSFGHIKDGSPGYYVVITGEVAHMMKCQAVNVIARQSAVCSSHMPVWYGNTSTYMEPVARILTNTSSEVPCSALTPSIYEIEDNWYQFSPNPVMHKTPIILSPSAMASTIEFQNIDKLMKSGLYGKETIDNFKNFISFPMIRMDANNYVSARVSGLDIYKDTSYTGDWLMSTSGVESRINEYMGKMFGSLRVFGAYAGAVWGLFVLYKILTKIFSITINAVSIHKAYGCGLHIFASVLDALTHMLFAHKKRGKDPKEGELHQEMSTKRWNTIREEEGWPEEPAAPPLQNINTV